MQVTEYFNNCANVNDTSEKLTNFHKIKEILLHNSPHLLPKYFQNVLNFTADRNNDVKKALVGFFEEVW